jgi:hypothetical protein
MIALKMGAGRREEARAAANPKRPFPRALSHARSVRTT